jgi:hypothetical protein
MFPFFLLSARIAGVARKFGKRGLPTEGFASFGFCALLGVLGRPTGATILGFLSLLSIPQIYKKKKGN